ncbi:MAG: hypothetical protein MI863_28985 [Desulfobacterales bacterium]|nr:hypothetical protein [Desulfobacterales bacterium]
MAESAGNTVDPASGLWGDDAFPGAGNTAGYENPCAAGNGYAAQGRDKSKTPGGRTDGQLT